MLSALLITSALIFYTVGVWVEHASQELRPWHAALFAAGLTCDATGTLAMMGEVGQVSTTGAAGWLTWLMMITGSVALVLMALHLAWAIAVLLRNRATERAGFHRLSIGVWGAWLVPFIAGGLGAMLR